MHRGPPIQAREKPLCLPQARVCGVPHNEPLGHVDERANVIGSDITRQRLANVDAGFNDVIQQKVFGKAIIHVSRGECLERQLNPWHGQQ